MKTFIIKYTCKAHYEKHVEAESAEEARAMFKDGGYVLNPGEELSWEESNEAKIEDVKEVPSGKAGH